VTNSSIGRYVTWYSVEMVSGIDVIHAFAQLVIGNRGDPFGIQDIYIVILELSATLSISKHRQQCSENRG